MDSVSAYERLFVPHGDGYVFHPTKKSGGKFVTAEEHARLIADIRRFQRRGPILIAAWIGVAIVGWMVADAALNLPEWADGVFQAAAIAAACVFAIRGFLGPYRLVKGREAIVPPRPRAELARETRAMLRWRHLILFGSVCAIVLFVELAAPERTLTDWAWIAVSGVLLCLFIWAAVRKLGDGA